MRRKCLRNWALTPPPGGLNESRPSRYPLEREAPPGPSRTRAISVLDAGRQGRSFPVSLDALGRASVRRMAHGEPPYTHHPEAEPMSNKFEECRAPDWRNHLDQDGRPTHGPSTSTLLGCQYCSGPLDATPEVGIYSCPWCIARFPTPTPPHPVEGCGKTFKFHRWKQHIRCGLKNGGYGTEPALCPACAEVRGE